MGLVGSDLLSHRSGDFGSPRALGRVRTSTPVCIDAIGETWAGYIAEGPEKGRMVLVTVPPPSSEEPSGRQILALTKDAIQIRHPNVLALLDVARQDGAFALVSEYLDGEPLSTLLSTADAQAVPIPQGVAIAIMKEAIDALVSIRQRNASGFPFGGISPDVIFVAAFGETMLRNPGIEARAMSLPECRRHPSALPYRAPEQLISPLLVEETVDVFSAGVILWELLAGRPLFGGKSHLRLGRLRALPPEQIKEMEARVASMPIPSLQKIPRHGGALHPAVIELVESALRREPSQRPATLRQLSEMMAALPTGLIASSVEIAATIEKLAGKAIQRRQRALEEGAPVPVYGSKPPSNRVTAAPGEGDPSIVEIPPGRDVAHIGQLLAEHEALPPSSSLGEGSSTVFALLDRGRDTSPGRPEEEDPFEAKTKTPQHERQKAASERKLALPIVRPSSVIVAEVAEPGEEHTLHTPLGHQIPSLPQKKSRTGVLWLAAALVLAAGGVSCLRYFSQSRANAVAPSPRTEREDPADAVAEVRPALTPIKTPALSEEAVARPQAEETPEEPGADDPEAEAPPRPSKAPSITRPARPPQTQKTPKEASGAYRPMGI